ncbi:hypothetical protein CPB83DRAFT_837201 [Crepidotus variabilis]|uniref:Uncharacterized protein n=1 Tax=Crepidotus variabilis TaxID=179855 RepID=A0A9P6EBW1_9AGAR|nr:hypothetical protein CPB83DRAFT_837201 [Crepidotus variabilis]
MAAISSRIFWTFNHFGLDFGIAKNIPKGTFGPKDKFLGQIRNDIQNGSNQEIILGTARSPLARQLVPTKVFVGASLGMGSFVVMFRPQLDVVPCFQPPPPSLPLLYKAWQAVALVSVYRCSWLFSSLSIGRIVNTLDQTHSVGFATGKLGLACPQYVASDLSAPCTVQRIANSINNPMTEMGELAAHLPGPAWQLYRDNLSPYPSMVTHSLSDVVYRLVVDQYDPPPDYQLGFWATLPLTES